MATSPPAVRSPSRHSAENPRGCFVLFVYVHLQLPVSPCFCAVDFFGPNKVHAGLGGAEGPARDDIPGAGLRDTSGPPAPCPWLCSPWSVLRVLSAGGLSRQTCASRLNREKERPTVPSKLRAQVGNECVDGLQDVACPPSSSGLLGDKTGSIPAQLRRVRPSPGGIFEKLPKPQP